MIRVLLVDDEPPKIKAIERIIDHVLSGTRHRIKVAGSAAAAELEMRRVSYDLLILDLHLPMRQGERPKEDGGVLLLQGLTRRGSARLPTHVIGLTAYDELLAKHEKAFSAETWSLVRFDRASLEWEEKLGRKLLYIADGAASRVEGKYDHDLAIITALQKVEMESVLELGGGWKVQNIPGDDSVYHAGKFQCKQGILSVVAAAVNEMGMPAATAVSMKMIHSFRPRVLAMVGIAAGIGGNYGDVLVADCCWDYGAGKILRTKSSRGVFLPAPAQIPVDPVLRNRLSWFASRIGVLDRIRAKWRGKKPNCSLEAKIGPFASGAAVVQDSRVVADIHKHNRKLIGIEMETYGVFTAARLCGGPRPLVMSVKSLCDYGDTRKNDRFQRYAAFTSANFLYEFAVDQLIEVCRR